MELLNGEATWKKIIKKKKKKSKLSFKCVFPPKRATVYNTTNTHETKQISVTI